jgi:hypothetical protein
MRLESHHTSKLQVRGVINVLGEFDCFVAWLNADSAIPKVKFEDSGYPRVVASSGFL